MRIHSQSFFPKLRRGHGRMHKPGGRKGRNGSTTRRREQKPCAAPTCTLNLRRDGGEPHIDPAANREDWLIVTGQAFRPVGSKLLAYTPAYRGF